MTMADELYLKEMGIADKDADRYLAALRDRLIAECASDKAWKACEEAQDAADRADQYAKWWRLCAGIGWALAVVAIVVLVATHG